MRRDRRRWLRWAGGAAVVVAAVGLTVWLRVNAAPTPVEIGFRSDDMESVEVRGLMSTDLLFRCEPGELTMHLGLAGAHTRFDATLRSVSLRLLDEVWSEAGWARRTSTEMVVDPYGSLDEREPFTSAPLGRDDWVRLQLSWAIETCPEIMGVLSIGHVDVRYDLLGRERRAEVELPSTLNLTTSPLSEFER